MHPKNLSIADFSYELPEEKIARYPLAERDDSRLLIYDRGGISEDRYCNIDRHIPPGTMLVFNNTKVVEARLLFKKDTGGVIEIFCLEPGDEYKDVTVAMAQQGNVEWKCLIGGASKWKHGQVLEKSIAINGETIVLEARYKEKRNDHFIIDLSWSPGSLSFADVLHRAGAIPLPPYIRRSAEASDADRYQTIYADKDGSVAAPTAGLHFTQSVFQKLQRRQIETGFVTLHVGAGTFKPVKAEKLQEHEMHAEFIDVPVEMIDRLSVHTAGVIAVGTTSLRTLESLYWFGVKAALSLQLYGQADTIPFLGQWEPYELPEDVTVQDALRALLQWMKQNGLERFIARTQIIIAPGYKARMVKALVTNFHQPGSTLLLLVAALIGADWKKVYDYALQNNFRFLSYGDGNLLWINE